MPRNYEAEGRRAFERGESADKNPYRFGSPHWMWSQGWTDGWWASPAGRAEAERQNAMDAASLQSDTAQGGGKA